MQIHIFFHQFVSGRRRKNTIACLDCENGEVSGQREITQHIVDYYKGLFGHNNPCALELGSNFWPAKLTLSEEDNSHLIKSFSPEEIREVVMNMKNSAPGPNGYGVVVFQERLGDPKGRYY